MPTPSVLFRALAPAVLAGSALAQVQLGWSTILGDPGLEQAAVDLAVDGAGSTFVAGRLDVDPGSATSFHAALTKLDPDGVVGWVRTYDGTPSFHFVAVDALDHVVVATSTQSSPATVARYDGSGNRLWLRQITGLPGQALSIVVMRVAPSGEIVLAGQVESASVWSDAFVIRLRVDGTTAWTHTYAGSSGWSDHATDVVLDAAGNAYVAGHTGVSGDAAAGIFAQKIGNDGTLAWSTEFIPPATGHHQGLRAAVDSQGRLCVADTLIVSNDYRLGVVQFDANGVLAWDRQLASTGTVTGVVGVSVRADDSVIVGAQVGGGVPQTWALVAAWSATGAPLWSTTYDAPGTVSEIVTDFDLDPAGGAILSGWQPATGPNHVLFAAHFTDGGQQDWTQILGVAQSAETTPALAVASDDSLRISSRWTAAANAPRIRVRRLEHDVTAFCAGDGSATACPCGNSGAPRSGCANSLGAGASLRAYGSPSLAYDTLLFTCFGLPQTTITLFQGTERVAGGAGVVFGDGLRCAGGTVARLGTQSASFAAGFPSAGQSLSLLGHVTTPGLRTYQCWYRNGASFCTPDTSNTSNGLAVLWRP